VDHDVELDTSAANEGGFGFFEGVVAMSTQLT
jgi:hypothetical protein